MRMRRETFADWQAAAIAGYIAGGIETDLAELIVASASSDIEPLARGGLTLSLRETFCVMLDGHARRAARRNDVHAGVITEMALKTTKLSLSTARSALRPLPIAGGANAAFYQSAAYGEWRQAVRRRDHFTCTKCGARGPGVRLYADHINEIADGGAPLDIDNGQTLCAACHNRKTAKARAARAGTSRS